MIVICDYTACVYNVACECTRQEIRLSEGYCMDSEDSGSTGEVIDCNTECRDSNDGKCTSDRACCHQD